MVGLLAFPSAVYEIDSLGFAYCTFCPAVHIRWIRGSGLLCPCFVVARLSPPGVGFVRTLCLWWRAVRFLVSLVQFPCFGCGGACLERLARKYRPELWKCARLLPLLVNFGCVVRAHELAAIGIEYVLSQTNAL